MFINLVQEIILVSACLLLPGCHWYLSWIRSLFGHTLWFSGWIKLAITLSNTVPTSLGLVQILLFSIIGGYVLHWVLLINFGGGVDTFHALIWLGSNIIGYHLLAILIPICQLLLICHSIRKTLPTWLGGINVSRIVTYLLLILFDLILLSKLGHVSFYLNSNYLY